MNIKPNRRSSVTSVKERYNVIINMLIIKPELQNVKSFTRTNIVKPDFTPTKVNRVNRDIFGTSNLQNRTYEVSCDE